MNSFCYDGEWSRTFGLYITGKGQYDAPERDVEAIEVPGRDGTLLIDKGRFKNTSVTYSAFLRNRLRDRTIDIKSWLLSKTGYRKLYDTYDDRYFRLAAFTGPVSFSSELNRFGETDLVFDCLPMRYAFDGERTVSFTASGTITNPEAFPSLPVFRVYGSGNCTLAIGGTSFVFSSVSEYVDFDCETMNAYKGPVSKNKETEVSGPLSIPAGKSSIDLGGGTARLDITPRWCTL